jgi:DNA polymerase III alpha subunit
MPTVSFIHLHVASGYSFKYGTAMPDALVERAAEFGMPALALTDRYRLAGVIRFAQACQRKGLLQFWLTRVVCSFHAAWRAASIVSNSIGVRRPSRRWRRRRW